MRNALCMIVAVLSLAGTAKAQEAADQASVSFDDPYVRELEGYTTRTELLPASLYEPSADSLPFGSRWDEDDDLWYLQTPKADLGQGLSIQATEIRVRRPLEEARFPYKNGRFYGVELTYQFN